MASDTNVVVLTGRLTADPELRGTPGGDRSICSMRVAFNSSQRAQGGQGWEDHANFVNVTVFGAQADSCVRFLGKGRRVAISGRLQFRQWQTQDGSNRSALDIVASQVQFLDAPAERTEQAPAPQAPAASGGAYPWDN